tara:strand:- start:35266 stop:35520 length:255 start_codon:yes stop_codon:yes gene_type:complete
MKYKLEKISDDIFEGFHPNGYDVGFICDGTIPLGFPEVGKRFYFNRENYKGLATSIVTLVSEGSNGDWLFKTENSTYTLTQIEG